MRNKYVKRTDGSLFVQLFHILTLSNNFKTNKLKIKSKIKSESENTLDIHQLKQLQCKVTYNSSSIYVMLCKVFCTYKNIRGAV